MSTLNLSQYIGKQALLATDKLQFGVFVQDAKLAYGNVRFQVSPISGKGLVWVDSSRVSFEQTPEERIEHGQV